MLALKVSLFNVSLYRVDSFLSPQDPSPLVAFKTPLLDLILSALNYHEPVYKKLACAIFSDLLHAQYVMDESEVGSTFCL